MLDKEKYQKQINHIRDLAKQHKGQPQKLVSKFVHLIDNYSLDGYSMTLVEATENTNIELHNGFTVMTGSSNQYTKLAKKSFVKMMAHDDKQGQDAWSNWQKNIPKSDKFAVCNVTFNEKKSTSKINVFNHDFHPVTYNDIVNLVKRFYAVKSVLDNQGQGMEVHPEDIVNILKHAQRVAKHGFIKEALNIVYNTNIADDAREIVNNNMFYKQHKNNHKMVIVMNDNRPKCKDINNSKEYPLDKTDLIKSVNNAISALKHSLFEYNKAPQNNDYTQEQKEAIHTLKHIDFSNFNKGISILNKWLCKHSNDFVEKYWYVYYNNQAQEDKDDYEILDEKKPSASKLKNDRKNWSIEFLSNKAKDSYFITSSQELKNVLKDYIQSTNNKHLKSRAKSIYHTLNNNQIYTHRLLSPAKDIEYRKATETDVKLAIKTIMGCFHLVPNLLHVFSKWQEELANLDDNLPHVKKEMESLKNKIWTLQGDLFSSTLDGVTDDPMSMKENPPFSIKNANSSTGLIISINDMKDYIKGND